MRTVLNHIYSIIKWFVKIRINLTVFWLSFSLVRRIFYSFESGARNPTACGKREHEQKVSFQREKTESEVKVCKLGKAIEKKDRRGCLNQQGIEKDPKNVKPWQSWCCKGNLREKRWEFPGIYSYVKHSSGFSSRHAENHSPEWVFRISLLASLPFGYGFTGYYATSALLDRLCLYLSGWAKASRFSLETSCLRFRAG